jgi:hypothetical protein
VVAKYPDEHRAQVLVEIAELTRRLPTPKMEGSNTPSGGRDRTTAPPLRVQQRRRTRNKILAALGALLVGGVAGGAATLRQNASTPAAASLPGRDAPAAHALGPAAPASIRGENPHVGSSAAPLAPAMTSVPPSASALGGLSSAHAPAPRTPAARSPSSSKPRPPATAPSTKSADDTTIDELDRVAPAPRRD